MKTLIKISKVLVFSLFAVALFGQNELDKLMVNSQLDSTQTYTIELEDGTKLVGKITSKNDDAVNLNNPITGHVKIPFEKIKSASIVKKKGPKDHKDWFANPNPTQYFLAPSAYNLEAGTTHYRNTYVILNSINYWVSDHISIGGGFESLTSLSALLPGGETRPTFYLTSKFGFEVKENLNAGVGVLYLNNKDFFDTPEINMAVGYGVVSYGTENRNLTAGVGYGFIDGELAQQPIVSISGVARVYERIAIVTENWLIPFDGSGYALFSTTGVRLMGKKMSVGLGILNYFEFATLDFLPGAPFFDFGYTF